MGAVGRMGAAGWGFEVNVLYIAIGLLVVVALGIWRWKRKSIRRNLDR
jgi:hypothetical protein